MRKTEFIREAWGEEKYFIKPRKPMKLKRFKEILAEIEEKSKPPICKKCGRTIDTYPDTKVVGKGLFACHVMSHSSKGSFEIYIEAVEQAIDDIITRQEEMLDRLDKLEKQEYEAFIPRSERADNTRIEGLILVTEEKIIPVRKKK